MLCVDRRSLFFSSYLFFLFFNLKQKTEKEKILSNPR